jgi:hypothetical protein
MRKDVFNGWIELRDPKSVPERLRRPVFQKSIEGASLDFESVDADSKAMEFFSEFNDLLAVALISEWSFDAPITTDGLLDLPSKTYDDVRAICAPFLDELIPDFGVDIDPKVDTDNLNASVTS